LKRRYSGLLPFGLPVLAGTDIYFGYNGFRCVIIIPTPPKEAAKSPGWAITRIHDGKKHMVLRRFSLLMLLLVIGACDAKELAIAARYDEAQSFSEG
jgi:hypothetical protein